MLSGPDPSSAVHIVLFKFVETVYTTCTSTHVWNVVVDSITQPAPIIICWSCIGMDTVPTHTHSLFRHYLEYIVGTHT